ncbi:MAG: hypothetical protein HZA89_07060 [Verrucomicrobia bacterium]|nr:hypothetical protein [Verrucomicrobiota bacterium]
MVDGSGSGYLRAVCGYAHLNPVRAKLLAPDQPLAAFRWSGHPEYLKEPAKRPPWLRVESAEQKAGRIVAEELSRCGWTEAELRARAKGDVEKVLIALRVRQETTVTLKWIAEHLAMGSWTSVAHCLSRPRPQPATPQAELNPNAEVEARRSQSPTVGAGAHAASPAARFEAFGNPSRGESRSGRKAALLPPLSIPLRGSS